MSDIDQIRASYVSGLKNAHAMETQAVELLSRQLERIQNYPEIEERMRTHLEETRVQRSRLEEVLAELSESHSSIKDAALAFLGNLAALGHTPASDEVLKNTLANYAFEHYEIAAYKSLIAMGDMMSHKHGIAAAQESLREEENMAHWIGEHIGPTTSKFLQRLATEVKADR
jgi:ferritin-like metal-binding protein YciE